MTDKIKIIGECEPEIKTLLWQVAERYLEKLPQCKGVTISTRQELVERGEFDEMKQIPDVFEFSSWFMPSNLGGAMLNAVTLVGNEVLLDGRWDDYEAVLVKDAKKQLKGVVLDGEELL